LVEETKICCLSNKQFLTNYLSNLSNSSKSGKLTFTLKNIQAHKNHYNYQITKWAVQTNFAPVGRAIASGGPVVPGPPFKLCAPPFYVWPPNYHEAVELLCAIVDSQ